VQKGAVCVAVRGGSIFVTGKLQHVITPPGSCLVSECQGSGKPELPRVDGVVLLVWQRLCYRTTSVPEAGELHYADTFQCHERCDVLKIFIVVMSLRRMNKKCLM